MLGNEGNEIAGVVLEKKQQRGLIQMNVPFDNLRKSRALVASKIVELVQSFYTETRIVRTVNRASLDQEIEETVVNGMNGIGEIVNDLTIGEYDVVVTTAPARDTYGDVQFAEALNLRKVGVQIPDHWVVKYSNLNDKDILAGEIQQIQGLAPPSEEEIEMNDYQQQIQIQASQLELEKLAVEIQEIQSQAQLNVAKAEVAVGSVQLNAQKAAMAQQAQAQKLQVDYTAKMQDLQNKLQLAAMHTSAKRADTTSTNATKRFSDEIKARADVAKTGLMAAKQTASKPAPAKKK
jgi:hypothetical protein